MKNNIYEYIKDQERAYETDEVRVGDNWLWNMKNHVQMIFHLKNSKFFTGENDYLRPFKNVFEGILNLAYWSEDIEVKDVIFYIENKTGRVLSFLIKKYHDEVYVKENNLDTLFDEITEDDVDYGGVMVQKGAKKPEVVFLPSVAFADQTDAMGGPMGFKFSFSPSKLRQTASRGWGDEKNGATISLEELITLATPEKDPSGQFGTKKNQTSGKNIEVYIVRGDFPEAFLKDNDNMEDYSYQLHIVGFYTGKNNKEEGVTLYRKKADSNDLKFHTSKKVHNRALGSGIGESLVQPQIWTNFLEIHKMGMLEAGSKSPLWTDDEGFTDRNQIQDMENLEITTIADGKRIGIIPTMDGNKVQLFEQSINSWYEQAQGAGSAFDPQLGKQANSGTTFRGQNQVIEQGRGIHDRRRGQRAKFLEEIYRDWIIPDMVKKIINGKKFLATLTSDELKWVTERVIDNEVFEFEKGNMLDGIVLSEQEVEAFREQATEDFAKKGNKHLIEILKDEFRGVEVKMGINIAGKQKNLSAMSDKILSIFQFVFSNPQGFRQVMQIPGMSSAFGDLLEFSGISGVDFANISQMELPQPQETPVEAPQLTPQA